MPPTPPSAALSADVSPQDRVLDDLEQRLWRRRMRVTGWLLAAWFAVTFGVSFFARELRVVVFGWPLSFWVAAQGALLVYMALVVGFARQMGRLDEERDEERDDAPPGD
jgi:putative solute:sodium symporter small subunit